MSLVTILHYILNYIALQPYFLNTPLSTGLWHVPAGLLQALTFWLV